jgi:hypothetical protein
VINETFLPLTNLRVGEQDLVPQKEEALEIQERHKRDYLEFKDKEDLDRQRGFSGKEQEHK